MCSWPTVSPQILAALLVLVSLGCRSGETPPHEGTEATDGQSSSSALFVPIDFQSRANEPLSEGLPSGSQNFGGVHFRIGSQLMQLGSRVFRQFPPRIEGVEVGQTCRAIHFLHSSQGGAYPAQGHSKHEDDGVEIGQYIMHYADGTQEVKPIVYGQDLRGWWDWDNNKPTTRSDVVWTGENPQAGRNGRKIRFYWAVWENPHPEKPIASIDFVSTDKKAAPFCLAISLERIAE